MFIVDNYGLAVFLCVITMLCWGSWANSTKLTRKEWRFELLYWDYGFGILLTTLLFAFTLGSQGTDGRGFVEDLRQAERANLMSAFIGGVVFNLANILLVAAIGIAGMSVAFPVGIGIALVLGVIVNYIAAPSGNASLIFGGVALIVAAILINATAYRRMQSTASRVSEKGLLIAVISGCLMGLFYKYVAGALVGDFHHPESGRLTPYTALVIFAMGIVASNFVFNTIQMRKPFSGAALTTKDYFSGTARDHLVGILGGSIWAVGMSLNIIASGKAGPAISYGLGQGATVVAALWASMYGRNSRRHRKEQINYST